ncbi:F-box/kelch-repeat protein At3g23880-like [Silene latifolia]|uniref:F-box/kelch-repeat protein At3g23880-like n=1 Tax=Silene latifolia TaxID=37657 RepID=UPI003D770DEC
MGDKEANAKNKQAIEQQCYIFDGLIFEEILLRLPVKSLIRFKSVSKQWYSIISSSKFAITHFMKSPLSQPSAPVNTLFIQCEKSYYFFSYDDDQISDNFEDSLVEIEVPFRAKKYYPKLTGCCNGLICLTPKHGDYFIIWNPATGQMHKYKSNRYIGDQDIVSAYGYDDLDIECGFGYASSIDDYKYVQVVSLPWEKGGDTIVYLFSFRENKWRKIEFDYKRLFSLYGQAVLSNEKLYWGAFGTSYYYIVSFDLVTERFDAITSPLVCLGDMGGFLGECIYKVTFTGDKLIHIVDSDAIVKSIDIPEDLSLDVYSHIVGFTRTGKWQIFCYGIYERDRATQ